MKKLILISLLLTGCAWGQWNDRMDQTVTMPGTKVHFIGPDLIYGMCGEHVEGCYLGGEIYVIGFLRDGKFDALSYEVLGHEVMHHLNHADEKVVNPDE